MPITEFTTLVSAQDGLTLALMTVRPEGAPRAIVQLAHGMCEHKERYAPFMEYLANQGCACVINDHRGHGASVRGSDDLGYFYENGDVALVEDLHQVTRWAKERWPDLPLFLFGHSMGSLAVRAYCEKYDAELDALVVCGSPGENAAAGAGLILIDLMSLFKGDHYRSELIRSMTTGGFAKRIQEGSWLSANPDNAAGFDADLLCGFNFTLNGNRALLKLMRGAYHLSPKRGKPNLPIRFYSGEDDPCAPDRKGFERAIQRMQQAGYTNVSGYMFPGLRHEILNETPREQVWSRIWTEAFEPYVKGDA